MAKRNVEFLTNIRFFDVEAKRHREVGERFKVSKERAIELVNNLKMYSDKYIVPIEIDKG